MSQQADTIDLARHPWISTKTFDVNEYILAGVSKAIERYERKLAIRKSVEGQKAENGLSGDRKSTDDLIRAMQVLESLTDIMFTEQVVVVNVINVPSYFSRMISCHHLLEIIKYYNHAHVCYSMLMSQLTGDVEYVLVRDADKGYDRDTLRRDIDAEYNKVERLIADNVIPRLVTASNAHAIKAVFDALLKNSTNSGETN